MKRTLAAVLGVAVIALAAPATAAAAPTGSASGPHGIIPTFSAIIDHCGLPAVIAGTCNGMIGTTPYDPNA